MHQHHNPHASFAAIFAERLEHDNDAGLLRAEAARAYADHWLSPSRFARLSYVVQRLAAITGQPEGQVRETAEEDAKILTACDTLGETHLRD